MLYFSLAVGLLIYKLLLIIFWLIIITLYLINSDLLPNLTTFQYYISLLLFLPMIFSPF